MTGSRDVMAPTLPGSFGGPPLESYGRPLLEVMADHVEALLDQAGWTDPVAIAGSSHGGVVALELAARGRAACVVALAPPWVARTMDAAIYAGFFLPGMTWLRLTRRYHARVAAWAPASGVFFHHSLRPTTLSTDDFIATLRSVAEFPLLRVMRHDGLSGRRMPDLDAVRCPVVLVQGTRDRFVPVYLHRRWAAALPAAECIMLPGFGHVPHIRDPERIAKLILDATDDAQASIATASA